MAATAACPEIPHGVRAHTQGDSRNWASLPSFPANAIQTLFWEEGCELVRQGLGGDHMGPGAQGDQGAGV